MKGTVHPPLEQIQNRDFTLFVVEKNDQTIKNVLGFRWKSDLKSSGKADLKF